MLSVLLSTMLGCFVQQPQQPDSARSHSAGAGVQDSTKKKKSFSINISPARRDQDWRRTLTPELLANAYADAHTRELVKAARAARVAVDSSILRYDALSRSRVSFYMRATDYARDHLVTREDKLARIRWERGIGARIQLIGARAVVPFDNSSDSNGDARDLPPIPYYPGREPLALGSGLVSAEIDKQYDIVHPLANGAEAYYKYATGDSVSMKLGDGRAIRLVELRLRPRVAQWNLVVGSVWLDAESLQVVRAAFKLATPITLSTTTVEGGGAGMFLMKTMMNPIKGQIDAVTAEYGLHNGRFWLPATEAVEISGQVSFMHMRVKVEQSYSYTDVNGREPVPAFEVAAADTSAADTIAHDTTMAGRSRRRHAERTAGRQARAADCAKGAQSVEVSRQFKSTLPVYYEIPCDTVALAKSPELPPAYSDAEDLFGMKQRDEMMAALRAATSVPIGPGSVHVHYGLGEGLTRYNRVEGLSAGAILESQIGGGLAASLGARIGTADLTPNGELSLRKESGTRATTVTVYRRLAVANDWGNPLGFGASLSALLFGRDDGFYYRTAGAEITHTHTGATPLTLRLFAEHENSADKNTSISLAHALGADDFRPNISASRENLAGVSLRAVHTFGYNPLGMRLLADARTEIAAAGSRSVAAANINDSYARAALDLTASRNLFDKLAGALTVGGGSAAGRDDVPAQKLFYLGGPGSIRGLDAGTGIGDSYWMVNAELGAAQGGARPVIFADYGWAGARTQPHGGRSLAGVGVGLSMLDGVIRIDVAKGLKPSQGVRANLYLEARW